MRSYSTGFTKAPVSLLIFSLHLLISFGLVQLFSLSNHKFKNQKFFNEDVFDLVYHVTALKLSELKKFQFWRLFTCHFFSSTPSDLLFASVLLYNFRVFERHFGSRKFSSLILLFLLLSTLLQIVFLSLPLGSLLFGKNNFKQSTGPYAIVFSLLYYYYSNIPYSELIKVFSISFSEKSYIYLTCLMYVGRSLPSSLICAIIGLIIGWITSLKNLPFHQFRLPQSFCNFCYRLVNCKIVSRNGTRRRTNNEGYELISGQPEDEYEERFNELINNSQSSSSSSNINSSISTNSTSSNSQSNNNNGLNQLVSMGFEPQESIRALGQANGDISQAVALPTGEIG